MRKAEAVPKNNAEGKMSRFKNAVKKKVNEVDKKPEEVDKKDGPPRRPRGRPPVEKVVKLKRKGRPLGAKDKKPRKVNMKENYKPVQPATRVVNKKSPSSNLPTVNGLDPKQLLCVNEFFTNGFNQTAAARAIYGESRAGRNVFKNPKVQAEVKRRLQRLEQQRFNDIATVRERYKVTKQRLYEEYARIAFAPLVGNAKKEYNEETGHWEEVIEITEEQAEIGATTPVEARDKRAALDSLAKLEGLFIDKVEVSDNREIRQNLIAGRQRVAGLLPEAQPDDAVDAEFKTVEDEEDAVRGEETGGQVCDIQEGHG